MVIILIMMSSIHINNGMCHLTLTSFLWSTDSIIIQFRLTIFGPPIDHYQYMSARYVSYDHDLIFMFSDFVRFTSIFVIRSVSPFPYNLGSPYLVNTLIIVSNCQPGMCHLTLTLFSWSTDFLTN